MKQHTIYLSDEDDELIRLYMADRNITYSQAIREFIKLCRSLSGLSHYVAPKKNTN